MAKSKSSPSLKEIQRTFSLAITRSESLEDALELIDSRLQHITFAQRFEVYSEAWFLRLEESLSEDFAEVKKRLGNKAWETMLLAYLQMYPSQSFTIARAADKLPAFLKQTGAAGWLVEVAQLELDLCRTTTSSNSLAFDIGQLQTLTEDEAANLRLALQPSSYLNSFLFNALELLNDKAVPRPLKRHVIVFRDEWSSQTEILIDDEFQFLSSLSSGLSLGEIADQQGDTDWLPWLVKWSQRGVIGPLQERP